MLPRFQLFSLPQKDQQVLNEVAAQIEAARQALDGLCVKSTYWKVLNGKNGQEALPPQTERNEAIDILFHDSKNGEDAPPSYDDLHALLVGDDYVRRSSDGVEPGTFRVEARRKRAERGALEAILTLTRDPARLVRMEIIPPRLGLIVRILMGPSFECTATFQQVRGVPAFDHFHLHVRSDGFVPIRIDEEEITVYEFEPCTEPATAVQQRVPAFLRWFGLGVYVALLTILPLVPHS